MLYSGLHKLHKQFPGIPEQALEFFHIRNAPKEDGTIRLRIVADFARHIARPGERPNVQQFPKFEWLNSVLRRMADLRLIIQGSPGALFGHDASYVCELTDENIAGLRSTLDYLVYGFPVIYEELRDSVIPLVHTNKEGRESIGTAFIRTHKTVLTAGHCLAGATALSLRGISAERFQKATLAIHKNDAVDLAAIYFKEPVLTNLKEIELGIGSVLDDVLVMGYPNVPGFTEMLAAERAAVSSRITVTKGEVASAAKEIFAKTSLFLIAAKVRGGFSGGPVIGTHGLAIGIVSRQPISGEGEKADYFAQYDNLGYGVAIPTEEIISFLTACKEGDERIVSFSGTNHIQYTPFPK